MEKASAVQHTGKLDHKAMLIAYYCNQHWHAIAAGKGHMSLFQQLSCAFMYEPFCLHLGHLIIVASPADSVIFHQVVCLALVAGCSRRVSC